MSFRVNMNDILYVRIAQELWKMQSQFKIDNSEFMSKCA